MLEDASSVISHRCNWPKRSETVTLSASVARENDLSVIIYSFSPAMNV